MKTTDAEVNSTHQQDEETKARVERKLDALRRAVQELEKVAFDDIGAVPDKREGKGKARSASAD